MDLLKAVSRRSRLGEVVYDVLNLAYAGLLLVLVLAFEPPYLAFLAVLLSKWRVLAVRPRFWLANIQSNLIDTMVGVSAVAFLWLASGNFWVQFGITMAFAAWLVFIKPRSKRHWILMQAGIGQFLGLSALFAVAYQLPFIVVIIGAALAAYATARHALTAFHSEHERTLLSFCWVFVIAELAWLSYHWTIAYALGPQIAIPEIALIATVLGFVAVTIYTAYENDEKIEFSELRWPLLFSGLVLILLLARFSGLDVSQL